MENNKQAMQKGLEEALSSFQLDSDSNVPEDIQKTLHLAGILQKQATAYQTPAERRQQAEFDRMMQRPDDKATLM